MRRTVSSLTRFEACVGLVRLRGERRGYFREISFDRRNEYVDAPGEIAYRIEVRLRLVQQRKEFAFMQSRQVLLGLAGARYPCALVARVDAGFEPIECFGRVPLRVLPGARRFLEVPVDHRIGDDTESRPAMPATSWGE